MVCCSEVERYWAYVALTVERFMSRDGWHVVVKVVTSISSSATARD